MTTKKQIETRERKPKNHKGVILVQNGGKVYQVFLTQEQFNNVLTLVSAMNKGCVYTASIPLEGVEIFKLPTKADWIE